MMLILISFWGLSTYQRDAFRKTYGLSEQVDLFNSNSTQVFNRLTRSSQEEIRRQIKENPEQFENLDFLENLNQELKMKYAYLIVRKYGEIIYCGIDDPDMILERSLPAYEEVDNSFEGGIYLDGESQHLIKQVDFKYSDGGEGSVFLVSSMDDYIPEAKRMFAELLMMGVLILLMTGFALVNWIYKSMLKPMDQLQKATHEIKNGNLDFTLDVDMDNDDEIGRLCQDFEEMRIRLKESAEEKVQYDKESKELISNISHDLKTPITAIKGYVEGIRDGVASSPEKLDKYIRTIYNKANDMDRLIDELTFYSKIDTNKIPYTFSKINVASYFRDCVEDVGLELDASNIELG